MKRFKILMRVTFLICSLLMIGIALKMNTNGAPKIRTLALTPEQTLTEQLEKQIYDVRKNKLNNAISTYFEKAIKTGDIVGAAVSIVKADSIVISAGFGKRKINSEAKVNGETVFRLGSLSKGFGGVLMANLKSEGKINWDDKVIDYVPNFRLGNRTNTAKIKVSHILSHTSGTPYHSYTNLVEKGLSIAEITKRFRNVKPVSKPGALYSYQNAMFALSEEVMFKVTGEKVNTLLENRFFKPLDMSTVSMDHKTIAHMENVAIPHVKNRRGWRSLPLKNGYYNVVVAGGINASSLDMAKWMRFLLGHNPEVMKKPDIQEVFKPFIVLNRGNKYYQRWPGHIQSSYGFGWRIHQFEDADENKEITIWHHGGSVNNYRNEMAIYPEADLGICVLLNGNSKLARNVIPDLYKIIKEIYSTTDKNIQSQWVANVQMDNN